jgi:hypothetical protein
MRLQIREPGVAADKVSAGKYRLAALTGALRFHGVDTDEAEIRRRLGDAIGISEIVRCAKAFGLRAWTRRSDWRRLAMGQAVYRQHQESRRQGCHGGHRGAHPGEPHH